MLNIRPGIISPWNTIENYQRYCTYLAKSTMTPPTTRVSDDGSIITFRDARLEIPLWRDGLARLLDDLDMAISELCHNQDFGLSIPPVVTDDWANEARGYSWLSSGPFLPEPRALLQALMSENSLNLGYVENDTFIFNTAAVWKLFERFSNINKLLSLALFFIPGQSPRVAEFVDQKHRNSTRGRNLFRDEESFTVVIRRGKTENAMGLETFQPSKVPPRLCRLLERVFCILRPIEEDLAFFLKGVEARNLYSEYMWVQNCTRVLEEQMCKDIGWFMRTYCSADIGPRKWRQINVEIARIYMGSEFEINEYTLDAISSQRGHTEGTAHTRYAAEEGNLMSSDLLLRYDRVSEMWWEVQGLRPNHPPMLPLRLRHQLAGPGQPYDLTTTPAPASVIGQTFQESLAAMILDSLQSVDVRVRKTVREAVAEGLASSSRIIPNLRPLQLPDNSGPTSENGMDVSQPEVNNEGVYSMNVDEPVINNEEDRYLRHLLTLHFPDSLNPSFKSMHQREGVKMTLSREHNFVCVLPTGGGKSLLYTLAALNEPNFQTYVVIPNKALLDDQRRRAAELSLVVHEWTVPNCKLPPGSQIIFVSVESATTEQFQT